MLDLAQVPSLIQGLNDVLDQNTLQRNNLDLGFNLIESKQNYLSEKLEAFENIITITIKTLNYLLELNHHKNEIEQLNSSLKKDLCKICQLNCELQAQVSNKQEQIQALKKELEDTRRALQDHENNAYREMRHLYTEFSELSYKNYSIMTQRETLSIPEALLESRVKNHESQFFYDELETLREQSQELRETISRLTAVISYMEEREQLRKQKDEQQLKNAQQQRQNEIERHSEAPQSNAPEEKTVESKQIEQQVKIEEEQMHTLTYTPSSHSLAYDISNPEDDSQSQSLSVSKRMKLLRVESAPNFEDRLEMHYQIEKKRKLSKNKRIANLSQISQKSGSMQLSQLMMKVPSKLIGNRIKKVHDYFKGNIVTKRIEMSLKFKAGKKNY